MFNHDIVVNGEILTAAKRNEVNIPAPSCTRDGNVSELADAGGDGEEVFDSPKAMLTLESVGWRIG